MAIETRTRLILATPVEFIRHMTRLIFSNRKDERDTSTTIPPLVSRAKSITTRSGFVTEEYTVEKADG